MKISIVTLSFNQRTYLQEAIDSVLLQDFPDLEYIIVDPGSTDGSRELIRSYGDRISQVVFEPDHGAADGLNKGFALATGDIYGFLNADDLLFPGSLSAIEGFFLSHPECDVVMGDGFKIDSHGHKIRHYCARDFTTWRYLHGGTRWLQQSTFFRKEIYGRSPKFHTENRTCWDGELFVNMAKQGAKFGYIRSDLGGFRIHDASISGSGRLNEHYRNDCRRIFFEQLGRKWSATDVVVRFYYRVEGFMKRIRNQM